MLIRDRAIIVTVDKQSAFTSREFTCFSDFFFFSTAALSDIKTHVLALLKRHSVVFGTYRWTEFDEDFLQKHVDSIVLADLGLIVMHLISFFFFFKGYRVLLDSVIYLILISASRLGEVLTFCTHIHPEWGWTQHAHSRGGWGAYSSQSLVAASR